MIFSVYFIFSGTHASYSLRIILVFIIFIFMCSFSFITTFTFVRISFVDMHGILFIILYDIIYNIISYHII